MDVSQKRPGERPSAASGRLREFACKALLVASLAGCGAKTGLEAAEAGPRDAGPETSAPQCGTERDPLSRTSDEGGWMEFQDSISSQGFHFNTEVHVSAGMRVRLVSGRVASGDPDNIRPGDAICEGSVVRVEPWMDGCWGGSGGTNYEIVSIFPVCGGGYCPQMIDFQGTEAPRPIGWLGSADLQAQVAFGNINDFSSDTARRGALGEFYPARATYEPTATDIYPGKEAGAGVFCSGTIRVRVDGSSTETGLPAISPIEATASGSGLTVGVDVVPSSIQCFGAVEKHPLDLDRPAWYFLYYFTHGSGMLGGSGLSTTRTMTVEPCP